MFLVSKELKIEELLREIEKYKTQSENYEKQNKQVIIELKQRKLNYYFFSYFQ